MATESVANEQPHGPYLDDTIVDTWKETGLPLSITHELADITRAVYGVRELTRMLAEDEWGREQMPDGVHFVPMAFNRRWVLNHAIKQLLTDAEVRLEKLPAEMKAEFAR
jgi:hypothetical protein